MNSKSFFTKQITSLPAKAFAFIIIFAIVIFVGALSSQTAKEVPIVSTSPMEKTLTNKKIAMIIAFKDFRDEEYFIPKERLGTRGAKIKTVSTELGKAIGSYGGEVEVDITLGEFKVRDFDAILFVGGPGALSYLDNEISYKIAKDAVSENKILAAICISPTILAKAGVLSGKRATVWSSPLDKKPIQILKENGAIYEDKSVVIDGNIITANGPGAAEEFGEVLVNVLK